MKKSTLIAAAISLLAATDIAIAAVVTSPGPLAATQVVTSGTPVTVILAGSVYNGCWIQNDPNATTSIIVDFVNVANHTTPASTAAFVAPGNTVNCPGASVTAVTVDSFDNGHKIYGVKY